MHELQLPLTEENVRSLQVGDDVSLNGLLVTARDAAHKWMIDTFIRATRKPDSGDLDTYHALLSLLRDGALYHCGPVVTGLESGAYHITAAGPTTSMREEPCQAEVLEHFHVRAVIGKGGMGPKTLAACQSTPAVYLHAVGGAAAVMARSIQRVLGVYKLEFGVPEAMWVIEVHDFPAVVTMDAHGNSLHAEIESRSGKVLDELLSRKQELPPG